MPFEVYRARVKIVRDEEVVKKWVEDQSWKTDYLCLNMPEPMKLGSMEAVEQHFRENHKANIIKQVESHTLTGAAARSLRSPDLVRLVRSAWEDQRRFPLQIATVLSQQFAGHGLQFFKVNKTITHVSVARPHYLDLALTPVSNGVKSIVDYVNAHPRCSRRQLIETLSPTPPPAPVPIPVEGQPAPAPQAAGPTPEQNALIGDLHWLIHQGHVIEFANGTLETAKRPLPRPPKPAAKKDEKPAETTGPAADETIPATTDAATAAAEAEAVIAAETPTPENVEPPSTADQNAPGAGSAIEPTEAPAAETQRAENSVTDREATPATEERQHAGTPAAPVESPS